MGTRSIPFDSSESTVVKRSMSSDTKTPGSSAHPAFETIPLVYTLSASTPLETTRPSHLVPFSL
eukprot:5889845-Prymnesium_polylepis.1